MPLGETLQHLRAALAQQETITAQLRAAVSLVEQAAGEVSPDDLEELAEPPSSEEPPAEEPPARRGRPPKVDAGPALDPAVVSAWAADQVGGFRTRDVMRQFDASRERALTVVRELQKSGELQTNGLPHQSPNMRYFATTVLRAASPAAADE